MRHLVALWCWPEPWDRLTQRYLGISQVSIWAPASWDKPLIQVASALRHVGAVGGPNLRTCVSLTRCTTAAKSSQTTALPSSVANSRCQRKSVKSSQHTVIISRYSSCSFHLRLSTETVPLSNLPHLTFFLPWFFFPSYSHGTSWHPQRPAERSQQPNNLLHKAVYFICLEAATCCIPVFLLEKKPNNQPDPSLCVLWFYRPPSWRSVKPVCICMNIYTCKGEERCLAYILQRSKNSYSHPTGLFTSYLC